MDDDLLVRYSRHIMLDAIGEEGQQKLSDAAILLVGLGGLGSPASMYLAAAGVGELILCDGDTVEPANLQRQIVHTTDTVGWEKTRSAAAHLQRLNPHCRTRQQQRLTAENAADLIAQADLVIDGSDNYATRHLVNRHCVLQHKPLVFGSAIGFDGQVSVFDARRAASPCYNCLFSQDDAAPDVRCSLLGVFSPLTGVIGGIQAAEAIKCIVASEQAPPLIGRLLLVDFRDMRWRDIVLPRDPSCAVCHAR